MKNLLIIRLDAIGDFIIFLGYAKHFRSIYPKSEYKITLICNSVLKGFAEEFSYWDRVIFIDRKKYFFNLIYRWYIKFKLFFLNVDTLINPVFSRESAFDILIKFVRCKNKIGINGDLCNIGKDFKRRGDQYYSRLIEISENITNEIERGFSFINQISSKKFDLSFADLEFVKNKPVALSENYYIISGSSGAIFRSWESEKFIELIELIYKESKMIGVLCGSINDSLLGEEIESKAQKKIINMVGKTDLVTLCSLLGKAKFVFSNETSLTHIATALNIPSLCILGGGHFGRFLPYPKEMKENRNLPICIYNKMACYNCDWKCIHTNDNTKPYPCIRSITVEEVWKEVKALLTGFMY